VTSSWFSDPPITRDHGWLPPRPAYPAGPHSLPRDVRFISELIDKLESDNIDPTRVYADGISNGGGIALPYRATFLAGSRPQVR